MRGTRQWIVFTLCLMWITACGSEVSLVTNCLTDLDCQACQVCTESGCQTDPGQLNACGQCGPEPTEVCGDKHDNDCDGAVDEGCGPSQIDCTGSECPAGTVCIQ